MLKTESPDCVQEAAKNLSIKKPIKNGADKCILQLTLLGFWTLPLSLHSKQNSTLLKLVG